MKRLFHLILAAFAGCTLSLAIASCDASALLDDITDRVGDSNATGSDQTVLPASSWTGKSLAPLAMGSGGAGAYGTVSGNPVFMAVYGDTYYFQVAVRSSDGSNWSGSTLPTSQGWSSIAYGNGRFVAVAVGVRDWGSPGVVVNPTTTGAYSTDGSSWTASTMPSDKWSAVCYDLTNGRFVAVSEGKASAYSANGSSWTSGGNLAISPTSMAYGGGRSIAIAYGSSVTAVSSNGGASWSPGGSLPSAASWSQIAYGNGRFVAVAYSSQTAAFSTDGTAWTAATLPSSGNWNSIAFGNGLFVAITSDTKKAIVSSNGSAWLEYDLPAPANGNPYDIALCGNGVFVALSTQWVATSR